MQNVPFFYLKFILFNKMKYKIPFQLAFYTKKHFYYFLPLSLEKGKVDLTRNIHGCLKNAIEKHGSTNYGKQFLTDLPIWPDPDLVIKILAVTPFFWIFCLDHVLELQTWLINRQGWSWVYCFNLSELTWLSMTNYIIISKNKF